MPRILVADDNSNIQKMVTMALKDEGFDVISVGNGQAAVRKLPEVSPDLVLADIFMPVRSGYEVCEYIKNDSHYSHIPVVLLVGAFDPLDENEAQRVRADGVLKKPFVPPDPLINMVKALVAKAASENLVPVATAVAASATAEAAHTAEPQPAEMEPAIEEFSDAPPEEFAPPEPAMPMEGHERPLAFGSLLETTVDEPEVAPHEPSNGSAGQQDDSVMTAMRDPSLGDPGFWSHSPTTDEVTAEEATEEHGWNETAPPTRHDDAVSLEPETVEAEPLDLSIDVSDVSQVEAVEHPAAEPEPLLAAPSWPEPPAAEEVDAQPAEEGESASLELPAISDSRDESNSGFALSEPSDSYHAPAVEEPSAPEPNPVPEQAPVSASLELPSAEELPQEEHLSSEYSAESSPVKASEPEHEPMSISSESDSSPASAEPVFAWDPEPPPAVHEFDPEELSQEVPSPEPSPVDNLSQEAPEPAADLPPAVAADPELEQPAMHLSAIETSAEPALPEPPAPTTESEPVPAAPVLSVPEPNAAAADASPSTPTMPTPEVIDAVVSRVLERMQPQVIEVVTREILRPVVEALVRRELTKE